MTDDTKSFNFCIVHILIKTEILTMVLIQDICPNSTVVGLFIKPSSLTKYIIDWKYYLDLIILLTLGLA
jgi:hypothetical protein